MSKSYPDVVKEVAENLNAIVAEPGFIVLSDHDTADLENATTEIPYGPSEDAIEAFKFKHQMNESMNAMQDFIGRSGVMKFKTALTDYVSGENEESTVSVLCIDKKEKNTLLMALRYYQQKEMGEPANRCEDIQALAAQGNEHTSVDNAGITALFDKIAA